MGHKRAVTTHIWVIREEKGFRRLKVAHLELKNCVETEICGNGRNVFEFMAKKCQKSEYGAAEFHSSFGVRARRVLKYIEGANFVSIDDDFIVKSYYFRHHLYYSMNYLC